MTADISRLFRDSEKKFHGLVHQQGRLPIDAEENHGTDIAQWTDEERFVETIAPSGSPDDGFKISAAGGAPIDFTIAAGSYYLGGSRIDNPVALTYRNQRNRNWLGFNLDAETPDPIAGATKFLVWLDAREAVVTATEDSELLEPGLGGPDGAARKRFTWHVRATPVTGVGCIAAAQDWLVTQQWTGKVNAETGLLTSGAALTVSFNPADIDQDLCQPSLSPGFLGARNECYRVQVTAPGRFVWGQDDAAPLYRVQVEDDGTGQMRRIRFLDIPRDEYVRPRADHTVELLRWDEILPNGQKTAEAKGAFFKVSGGYVDDSILLSTQVSPAWISWLGALPNALLSKHDDQNEQRYFYLRVWTGGGQGAQPDIAFANPNLAGTGLSLSFAGTPMPGDSWTIAARPNAPDRVMPWALMDGMAPHAPRRHVVPLAYVDLATNIVVDCRRRFRPLYKIGGCCTVTVGDGVSSWGDVSTIAAALARLPASGGEICIGPGIYNENIVVSGRANIMFTGCGGRTRWTAQDPSKPLLQITNCEGITVRRMRMEGGAAQCILADLPSGAPATQRNRNLAFEELDLAAPSGSALLARRTDGLRLRLSTVTVGPFPAGPAPTATQGLAAVQVQGDRLLVERNRIAAPLGPKDLPSQRPLGGLHICGDSHGVVVLRNEIEGGAGNGITLGSVRLVKIQTVDWQQNPFDATAKAMAEQQGMFAMGFVIVIDEAGCIHIVWQDPGPKGGGGTLELPVSEGFVTDIRIEKNRIVAMGTNGIATFPMYLMLESGEPAHDAVGVENVLVLDNVISGCMTLEPPPASFVQSLYTGYGGIALGTALDCTIRDNRIIDNGTTRKQGVCGVFIGVGEDIRIERNCIQNNGGPERDSGSAAPAGGIYACFLIGGPDPDPAHRKEKPVPERNRPALTVENNLVQAPRARALRATAMGAVQVVDNRLIGANPSQFYTHPLLAITILLLAIKPIQDMLADPNSDIELNDVLLLNLVLGIMGGDAVLLLNLGSAREWEYRGRKSDFGMLAGSRFVGANGQMAAYPAAPPPPPPTRSGETMVADNQVCLDILNANPVNALPGTLTSVLILTGDDLSFADNQVRIQAEKMPPLDDRYITYDVVLIAATVRATSNRLLETIYCNRSMLSFGLMNTTMLNQSTFEILPLAADPTKKLSDYNLSTY